MFISALLVEYIFMHSFCLSDIFYMFVHNIYYLTKYSCF